MNVMKYLYGMRLRGFSLGCQPKGAERRDDPSGRYYDIIVYDRKLPLKDEHYFDLDFLGVEDDGCCCNQQENPSRNRS